MFVLTKSTQLTKNQREKTQVTRIRNERGDISTDCIEIKSTIKKQKQCDFMTNYTTQ